jgi:hypothetical protein
MIVVVDVGAVDVFDAVSIKAKALNRIASMSSKLLTWVGVHGHFR